jgi:hypothetical protein
MTARCFGAKSAWNSRCHPGPPYLRSIRVTRTLVQTGFLSFSYQLSMDPNRTLALQVSHRHCDAVLGRDAQQQVTVIRHRIALQRFYPLLTAKPPEDSLNLAEHFQRTSSAGTSAESPHDTCSPTSRGTGYANLSSGSSLPLEAFLSGASFHIPAGNGRACAILTARGGGLTGVYWASCNRPCTAYTWGVGRPGRTRLELDPVKSS